MSKPTFEHRHYCAIAACLAASVTRANSAHATLIEELSQMFARDNPRFDAQRFVAAVYGRPTNSRDKVR